MSSSVTDDVQPVYIVVIKLVCLLCYCCYLLELNMNPCFVYSHVSWTCYELINRMSDKNMLSLIAAQLIPTLFYNDAIRQGRCAARREARRHQNTQENEQMCRV